MKLEQKMSLALIEKYSGFFAQGQLITREPEHSVNLAMTCCDPGINRQDVFVVVDFSPVGILATNYASGRKCFLPLDSDYTAITEDMIIQPEADVSGCNN